MQERHFTGTRVEIGQQMGELYARSGQNFRVSPSSDLKPQLAFYERHAPEIIEEIRGIAKGGNVPFEAVAQKQLAEEPRLIKMLGQMMPKKSCSIGGMKDAAGQSWVARNYDWCSAIQNHVQLWRLAPKGERRLAVVTDMGILSSQKAGPEHHYFCPDDAVNEAGLWIGLTFAYCWETQTGLTSADALRLVAERCETVDQALAFFERTPLCSAKNFFIADRKGAFAIVQHAAKSHDTLRPDEDGILVLTNHYQGSLSTADQIPGVMPHSASFARETQLRADLRALKASGKKADFETLDRLMTRPETPVCQCFEKEDIQTVYTLLSSPTTARNRLITAPREATRQVLDFTA